MMGLQIFFQELGGVAFSRGVADQDNLIRRSDLFRDLLIKRILFRYALATVMRFLPMNQMVMEMERIVRAYLVCVCRTTATEILINMSGVVVDDDNHPAGLGRFFSLRTRSRFFQESAQPGNFLHVQIMGVRPLEKGALAANAEYKFIVSVWLDLSQMLDQFDGLAPTQVMG